MSNFLIKLVKEIQEALDIKFELLTKEEAAKELLAREVTFKWRPTIVESK